MSVSQALGLEADLVNPIWSALTGPHRHLGSGDDRLRSYRPDVALFSAIPHFLAPAWENAADAMTADEVFATFTPANCDPGERFITVFRVPGVRMVAEVPIDGEGPSDRVIRLGEDDVDEMVALVEATNPGPFARSTIECGLYHGIRDDEGRLVAMAGERLHTKSAIEVSGVCTAASARGQGLAGELVRHACHHVRRQERVPFLHVLTDNEAARTMYEGLGFELHSLFDGLAVRLA